MNHNYIRPGGVAADLPDGWEDDVAAIIDTIPGRLDEYDELLTGQPIFRERTEGVGHHQPRAGTRHGRHRTDPAGERGRMGPAAVDAVPVLRPGRFRRHRRHGRGHASIATPCA